MLTIQETKLATWDDTMKDAIWPILGHDWITAASLGLSGGLAISWNKSIISKIEDFSTARWIWVRAKIIPQGNIFNIINVYAPHSLSKKKLVWQQIKTLMTSRLGEPFCLIGDFNCIRNEQERAACIYKKIDSKFFNGILEEVGVWEVPLVKINFTWHGPAGKKSRLDRAFVNNDWPDGARWRLEGISRKSSHHNPIILNNNHFNWGPVPFKAFNFWLEDEVFKKWIQEKMLINRGANNNGNVA
ncbi:uncharacterized protein LOC141691841 [Apium graveolens]|uniref:uncharacterized protein LOC141691841 n=1 Tax=Apium graveolens TaxID=4045 RepID=UPI003D7BC987